MHFTNMIWGATAKVGCAVSECKNLFGDAPELTHSYTVCRYWPRGNIPGLKVYEVEMSNQVDNGEFYVDTISLRKTDEKFWI